MNPSIFEKFKSLPIVFEYFYKQLTAFAYEKVAPEKIDELEEVAAFLKLTKEETLVLAVVFYLQYERYPGEVEVINRLVAPVVGKNGDVYEIVQMFEKLDVLERDHDGSVKIIKFTAEYFRKIRDNRIEELNNIKPVGLIPMLNYFNLHIINKRFQSVRQIRNEIDYLCDLNPELTLVKKIFKQEDDLSAFMIGAICAKQLHSREAFNTSFIRFHIIDYLAYAHYLIKDIANGQWDYLKKGWIKISGEGLMNDDVYLELDESGIHNMMPELDPKQMEEIQIKDDVFWKNLIQPEAISYQKLHFNADMQSVVKSIENLCQVDFKTVDQFDITLDMKGACVLFYGQPGMGKTELALQLAKKSGRPLFKVEVSQIISKWVGDSERLLKESLSKYRRMAKNMDVAPILFLNECDQILSTRVTISDSIDQMHNNLQNILLEEFEKLEGLLIATTNLTKNLDKAFERRFLYKVQFHKPEPEIRKKLWRQYLPQFNESELNLLMAKFDLLPAEIKNIAKKLALSRLFDQAADQFLVVQNLCQNERLESDKSNRIGF